MSTPVAKYPGNVWDGLSVNKFRKTRPDDEEPNFQDWDQAVSEILATQTEVNAVKALRNAIRTVTASTTVTLLDGTIVADATGAPVVVTLPDATTCAGQVFRLKKKDASANAVSFAIVNAQTIEGASSKSTTTQWIKFIVQSDGANWILLS